MKKLLFTLFLMIGAICANAQTAKIYKDGTVVQTIDNIDSVRFSQETTTIDIPSYTFSVSSDKKVVFSPGNLQYTQSTNTWAFAEHQYDTIGAANISDGALADKIDLFGWSSDNTATPFGISLSTDKADYSGDFVDWGANTIDTDAPNTWRTLTKDEWTYLFQHTHWTMAKVNGVLGFMLLPNGFVAPTGLAVAVLGDGNLSGTELRFNESDYAGNVYTAAEFAQLESLGVVFLPCAGYRKGLNVVNVGSGGNYWSATPNVSDNAKCLSFSSQYVGTYDWYNRDGGQSVRLVQDVQAPAAGGPAHTSAESTEITTQVVTIYQPSGKVSRFNDVDSVVFVETPAVALSGKFSVAIGKQITFSGGNLQYTQSTNSWAFAEHQYDIIGAANVSEGALADKIDLFGWSANNTTAPFGVSPSTDYTDYSGDFVDWGTNTIGSDAPNTWRTLTNDEWSYLRYTRTNADNLIGVACITLSGSSYVNGLILLPDDWTCPEGITFKSGFAPEEGDEQSYSDYQTISLADWQKMEAAGAVFLPATGYRDGSNVLTVGFGGNYWSATPGSEGNNAWDMYFYSDHVYTNNLDFRPYGQSVRLVKDL